MAYWKRLEEDAKAHPWMHGRMALSKKICRFLLPIDMKQLENMSPCTYLEEYCIICKRRQKLYTLSFDKQLSKRKNKAKDQAKDDKALNFKELCSAFKNVHSGRDIIEEHMNRVFTLAGIDKEDNISNGLFLSICALSERILYSDFITEDTDTKEYSSKDLIENSDFEALKWKLEGLRIKPELRSLLFAV